MRKIAKVLKGIHNHANFKEYHNQVIMISKLIFYQLRKTQTPIFTKKIIH